MFLILTGDVQSEVYACASGRQAETHDDEDGGVGRDTHEHPKHHRQGQRGQQSLRPAQPADTQQRFAHSEAKLATQAQQRQDKTGTRPKHNSKNKD